MKRLYFDELFQTQSEYDYEELKVDIEGVLNKERLGEYHYQNKIKKALNTYIFHPELKKLYCLSIAILLLSIGGSIINYTSLIAEIDEISRNFSIMQNNTNDVYFITF